jgi:hypothetical protein
MSITFSFSMSCQLLGVDPKTLRHWLAEASMEPGGAPTDSRKKLLTLEQLYQVALLYRRPITPPADPGGEAPPAASAREGGEPSSLLSEEVERLRQQLAYLEGRLATVCDHLALLQVWPQLGQVAQQEPLLHPMAGEAPGSLLANVREAGAHQAGKVHHWCPLPAELRARTHLLPVVEYGAQGRYLIISPQEGELSLLPDSPAWFDWLASLVSFRFVGRQGRFSAYRVYKQGGPTRSWKASRCAHYQEYKLHLGITPHLTLSHLEQAAATLQSRVASL